MPEWTPAELLEIARRRRVLGNGNNILSDEQILQIADPGAEHRDTKGVSCKGSAADDPLVSAILLGSVDSVRVFLENGASPDQRFDKDGATLLMRLIDRVCDPRTPIAIENAIGCMHVMLEHRADVNLADPDNHTALHRAFVSKMPAAVDVLLAHGAIAKRCSNGQCQKCILGQKIASRRKPCAASEAVRIPAAAAAAAAAAEKARIGTFEQVLAEEFGEGDFSSIARALEATLPDEAAAEDAPAGASGSPAGSKKKRRNKKKGRAGGEGQGSAVGADAAEPAAAAHDSAAGDGAATTCAAPPSGSAELQADPVPQVQDADEEDEAAGAASRGGGTNVGSAHPPRTKPSGDVS
eukprot:735578-Prymnesium_polylepis.1